MGGSCTVEHAPGGNAKVFAPAPPINACTNISVADKDSKGMLNHRLLVACRDNDLQGVRQTINEGAFLETRRPFVMRPTPPDGPATKKKKHPREGLTPLMYTVQNESLDGARLLLEARASVNACDEDGLRPLHFAASAGSVELSKLLLAFGAELDAKDEEGRTAADHLPDTNVMTRVEREQWEATLDTPIRGNKQNHVQSPVEPVPVFESPTAPFSVADAAFA